MYNIIDLTLDINDKMTIWPDPKYHAPELTWIITPDTDPIGRYSGRISFHNHAGTHIDTPKHFAFESSLDDLDLNVVCGPAIVLKFPTLRTGPLTLDMVKAQMPEGIETKGKRLLLTCGYLDENWTKEGYFDGAPYVSKEVAEWAVEQGFVLVGVDMQTDGRQAHQAVHKTLLSNGIYILEYISNVAAIPDKPEVYLVVAPLKLTGMEASTVRAMIIDGLI